MELTAKYGVALTLEFPVIKAGDTAFAATGDWTPVAADTKISKDGGNVANTTNVPVAIGGSGSVLWKLTLTATEMEAARVAIQIIDAALEDQAILISTYGHASAQHAFDLDTAVQDVNLTKWRGSTPSTLSTGDVRSTAQNLTAIADAILNRAISNVEPAAVFRSLYGLIASLVNRSKFNVSGDLEIYKTDDTTVLETLAATVDEDQKPITELDPP